MEKINAEELKILINKMPESIRKLYDCGNEIKVKIIRNKPLKRYGDEINMRIWRDMIIDSDLSEFERPADIANNILGYFLYGECGKILKIRNSSGGWKDYIGYDFGIRFNI